MSMVETSTHTHTHTPPVKNAIVGFSNSVSKEGAKYNILCNTIAPQAWSRMTKDIYPPGEIVLSK